MFGMGMQEMVVIGIVAILLFGKNLPGVAKTAGTSYRNLRKSLFDLQSSLNIMDDEPSTYSPSKTVARYDNYDDYDEAKAPKFEPPPSEPDQPS